MKEVGVLRFCSVLCALLAVVMVVSAVIHNNGTHATLAVAIYAGSVLTHLIADAVEDIETGRRL